MIIVDELIGVLDSVILDEIIKLFKDLVVKGIIVIVVIYDLNIVD